MKVIACLDEFDRPFWVSFPTTEEEIAEVLTGFGFDVVDSETIDYEDAMPDSFSTISFLEALKVPQPAVEVNA